MFIKIKNASKYFEKTNAEQFVSFGRILSGKVERYLSQKETIVAVDNVSLNILEGERVGIIGHNGAGKSTLLHMIAGLSELSAGSIEIDGRVDCIMTLGVGLREELSGIENIYIDGQLNNKTRQEIDFVIDHIVEFADLGEFIKYPVRTYSSGMKARLAFSMIIFIDPEVLIVDEALSAGDYKFSQKASIKMKDICDRGRIFILVSHSMGSIVDMCNRCIWLHKGKMMMDGDPETVTQAYLDHVKQADENRLLKSFKKKIGCTSLMEGIEISKIVLIGVNNKVRSIFNVGEPISVLISINCLFDLKRPDIRIMVERVDGIVIIDNLASNDGFNLSDCQGNFEIEISFNERINLGKQTYQVSVELLETDNIATSMTVATATTVLRIENGQYPYENPVTWVDATWRRCVEIDNNNRMPWRKQNDVLGI